MQIEVKDPATGALLQLNAKSEHFKGMKGFRIMHSNGSSFFIANRSGTWRSADDHHIDADFLTNIGLALEGYQLRDQVRLIKAEEETVVKNAGNEEYKNEDNESEPYSGNQPNINDGMGDEGIVNPNNP